MDNESKAKVFIVAGVLVLCLFMGSWLIFCLGILIGLWLLNKGLLMLGKPTVMEYLDQAIDWCSDQYEKRRK